MSSSLPSQVESKEPGNPLGWVPLALGAWFVIFGTYEMVERTFLRSVSPALLHVLHIVRGTGTSFLLAGIVAWYILRRAPAPTAQTFGGLRMIVAETEAIELAAQARWIIRLRWIAIIGVSITAVLSKFVFGVISSFSMAALLLIAGIMLGYNALFVTLAADSTARPRLAFAQVYLDMAALTLMIYFTGGIQNPFFLFYFFHIVIAGILLRKSETYFVTASACLFFCGATFLQEFGLIAAYPLIGVAGTIAAQSRLGVMGVLVAFAATAWCTAYFTTTIVEKLRRRGAQILEAGELLTQERAKTEDIVRSVGAGLVILDRANRIVWANEIARGWFGPDAIGESCFRHLWHAETKCADCPAGVGDAGTWGAGGAEPAELISVAPAPSMSPVPHEFPPVTTLPPSGRSEDFAAGGTLERAAVIGGKQKFFMVSYSPIRSIDGKVEQVLSLIQDVTSVKEMEIQLIQAGKMAAVGQLAAGIAHEINNPLAIIASSAEILSEKINGHQQNEAIGAHMKKIEDNIYRCKDIIRNLLEFARRDDEDLEEVDVCAVLEDTIRLVTGAAKTRERIIVRSYRPDATLVLPQSRSRYIQQVVLNMLLNAIDSTTPGGRISLAAERKDGGAEIGVADDGCGIAPENIAHLFEPFFTTKSVGTGTGLGLYLSHQFVDALGGRIKVESRVGEGTVFRVWLPKDSSKTGRRLLEGMA